MTIPEIEKCLATMADNLQTYRQYAEEVHADILELRKQLDVKHPKSIEVKNERERP